MSLDPYKNQPCLYQVEESKSGLIGLSDDEEWGLYLFNLNELSEEDYRKYLINGLGDALQDFGQEYMDSDYKWIADQYEFCGMIGFWEIEGVIKLFSQPEVFLFLNKETGAIHFALQTKLDIKNQTLYSKTEDFAKMIKLIDV